MRKRSTSVTLSAAFLGLAASLPTLGACAQESQTTYCGDEHRYVVESNRCDGSDSTVFIYHGFWNTSVKPGQQLSESGMYSDASGRVRASDADARTKAGLPARGGFGGNGATFNGKVGG